MDVRADELELLRRTVVFAPLSYAALRRLASALGEQHAVAGEAIVRQGEDGEIVYVITEGRVAVTRDGDAVGELGPDDTFGEAALLLDLPRNATVTAISPLLLRTLRRGPFPRRGHGQHAQQGGARPSHRASQRTACV
jgi:putative ABC transport system ATP-binding protein